MKIVGRVLKKTAEIGFKRNQTKNLDFTHQIDALEFLLNKAKKTNFGKNHDFTSILKSQQIIKDYQDEVPIVDYEEFYQTWLHRSIDGLEDHTWPGNIKYYALSSGTTGAPSKRIPVTKEMIKSFQKTSMRQISTLHLLNLPAEFYQKSILVVGGSTALNKIENHVEGDLSGILKKHTSWVASPFTQPPNSIAEIKDWNIKLDKLVENAPNWDIGIIAGVPSWCIMLIERIISRYNLNSIHDIWPNFKVYLHGGVFMQPYYKRFEQICGSKVHLLDTYLASEGYFAYQNAPEISSMKLLINNQIFFEFIPFDDQHFSAEGQLKNKYKALTLDEVEEGKDYALVISTNSGLWRYLIGDLVQFTSVLNRQIKITGRIKQYLSLVGEHLSLDNINEAVVHASNYFDIEIQEYCIYVDEKKANHYWNLGVNTSIEKEKIIQVIDQKLKEINDDYASVRKYNLSAPDIRILPINYFYKFLERMGKLGSQNKFPRVMNQHQASEWKRYLQEQE